MMFDYARRRKKAQVTRRHKYLKIAVNLKFKCGALGPITRTRNADLMRFRSKLFILNGSI
uniref:Uncharacterized protein n=1 Tax=Helianthus annuus TaxID=4232 RepID=A0A251S529_HELAN